MNNFFHQKVVVVTGASSGIGADLARQLAPLGTRLVLAARSKDKLNSLHEELKSRGSDILVCPTDVSDMAQVKNLILQTEKKFGTIDILINNAGIGHFGPLDQADAGQIRQVMETNYWGAVYACLSAIPIMKARASGTIVNITSTASFHGYPHLVVYSSAKAALHSLSEGLRIELAPFGIRVVEIQPGVIDNEFHINALGQTRHLYRVKQIRGGDPKQLTRRILQAIASGKREIVYPQYWRLYKLLVRLFPKTMEWLIVRTQVPKLDLNS